MSNLLEQFDAWLADDGPAALVIHEHLMPVEGPDGVLFPATFAASEDKTFKGGYNIDTFPDGKNVCLIDSVGSQANRMEPLFTKDGYAGLVPSIVIKAGNKKVNLLEAGHRAGDAIVRCSALKDELRSAFKDLLNGDAEGLARIAPTSIVFGAWDSRDTQAKLPRLVASSIRAFDVRALTRSAQYIPAANYVAEGLLEEAADKTMDGVYAERGFKHVPASRSHGGIIATGGIRRDASLHLAALRATPVSDVPVSSKRLALQRYVLGLALTAFTHPFSGFLRQGCNLVLDPARGRTLVAVYPDGRNEGCSLTHQAALAYAKDSARAFGIDPDRKIVANIPPDREVDFDAALAKVDVTGGGTDGEKKSRKAAAKKAARG